jgi:hypothetical protein
MYTMARTTIENRERILATRVSCCICLECHYVHSIQCKIGNVSQVISSFDDDIGFVAGLPVGTQTIAHAFKAYGQAVGRPYTALYNGKWGIGVRFVFLDSNSEKVVAVVMSGKFTMRLLNGLVVASRDREPLGPIRRLAWDLTIFGTHRARAPKRTTVHVHLGLPLTHCLIGIFSIEGAGVQDWKRVVRLQLCCFGVIMT